MTAFPGVIGFMDSNAVPYNERQPDGTWLNGFADSEAFRRVQAGYACGSCLAIFAHYMPVCPVCGLERDVAADLRGDPDGWRSYYDEHMNGTGDGKGGPTVARTADEAIASIFKDPDIENVPVKKLGPSKFGRGRPS